MDELLQEMIDPAPPRHDVARRRRLISSVAILVLAGTGVATLATAAVFTDNKTVDAAEISTGSVDLTAGDLTFAVPASGLAPGDTLVAPLTVQNTGTLAYRYSVRYEAADTTPGVDALLTEWLQLRVYALDTCTKAATDTASADRLLGSAGTKVGTGPLSTNGLATLVGDMATGQQTGDRVLLAVEGSEQLCVRVDLPLDTPDALQSTSADLTLRLDAEQTTNNP
ncbi:hypothetical protein ACGIF2_15415 [Cellulomonas sp. P22]|uniref:hypothetical protein n=1 Tax=Cellulomonas sp. P22 TaxID=3373189 RepID=UPI0037AD260A